MQNVFMNTYHRLPVSFDRGEGAWLFDGEGQRYLDFTSGIAVNCLGHAYPPLVRAVAEQSARIIHTSNYYSCLTAEEFARRLVAASSGAGMRRVFLANSGAEANEGACKIARKYSYAKYGRGRHTIVTLKGSFHGRTITTLAATGQDNFHKDFWPFTEGFVYVDGGDIEALDRALDGRTVAAFFVEAVQGESGIRPQSGEYLSAAAAMCAERDILFMFDEIQTGIGRTGTFLACEGYGIKPDVVTLAKGLAGGLPCAAVLAGEKAADTFGIGDHGSTFGGNPVAAAAGLVVLDVVTKPPFLEAIKRKGELMLGIIKGWQHEALGEIRGKGMMVGIDLAGPAKQARDILEAGVNRGRRRSGEAGLLLLSSGKQTLRLLPPYIISENEIEQGLTILKELITNEKNHSCG